MRESDGIPGDGPTHGGSFRRSIAPTTRFSEGGDRTERTQGYLGGGSEDGYATSTVAVAEASDGAAGTAVDERELRRDGVGTVGAGPRVGRKRPPA